MSKFRNFLRFLNKVLGIITKITIPLCIICFIVSLIINKDLESNIFFKIFGLSAALLFIYIPVSITIYISLVMINRKYFNNEGSIDDVPKTLLFLLRSRKRKEKELKLNINNNNNYFRDIPCNKDLLKTYWLCYYGDLLDKNTNLIGALLLKWSFEDKITFDNNDTQIIFKDHNTFDYDYEFQLFNILKVACNNDNILNINEFKDWCKSYGDKLFEYLESVLYTEEDILIKNHLIEYLYRDDYTKEQIVKIKNNKYTISEELNNNYNEIIGFKNFIRDFSLMDMKEIKEVNLWEEYLVFAYLIGNAKTSDEKLDKFISKYRIVEKILNEYYV